MAVQLRFFEQKEIQHCYKIKESEHRISVARKKKTRQKKVPRKIDTHRKERERERQKKARTGKGRKKMITAGTAPDCSNQGRKVWHWAVLVSFG